MNWGEFRPTILFLVKFIGLYFASSLLYGLFITMFEPEPDPVTQWVTDQSAWVLTMTGWPTQTVDHHQRPITSIMFEGKAIVSVYEGCNGLNVAIIFLSFLLAIGPFGKPMLRFAALGLLVIHVCNILRIILLFQVTLNFPKFIYVTHKYFFTAGIYAVVFVLWIIWVRIKQR